MKIKNIINILTISALCIFMGISCSKENGSNNGSGTNTPPTPSNLTLTADIVGTTVQNPNGDGTGIVNFTINATNATSYKVLLGNGLTQDVTAGTFSVTYTTSGTNTYTVFASAYNGAQFVSTSISITVYVGTGASTLLWSDEFNIDGAPSSANWKYDLGNGSNGWGNNELEYYTDRPQNVIVQGGILKIMTIKEPYSGFNYTSTRMLTSGKFSFKYGKVEVRAKLPTGAGTWPAIWMLGDNFFTGAGWPACGEIDIMEHAANRLNKIQASLHHPGHSGGNPDGGFTNITGATTDYHIYSIDWRADFMKFYVDNNLYYTFTNTAALPFNNSFFIILNSAMGGNFGGAVDPNFTSSTFEVDYVRVYN